MGFEMESKVETDCDDVDETYCSRIEECHPSGSLGRVTGGVSE